MNTTTSIELAVKHLNTLNRCIRRFENAHREYRKRNLLRSITLAHQWFRSQHIRIREERDGLWVFAA